MAVISMHSRYLVLTCFVFLVLPNLANSQRNICNLFPNLCQNGGTCVQQGTGSMLNVACDCPSSFTGLRCETGLRCYTCTTEVECDAENVPYESCGIVDSICIGINVTATVVIGTRSFPVVEFFRGCYPIAFTTGRNECLNGEEYFALSVEPSPSIDLQDADGSVCFCNGDLCNSQPLF
ncbi:uncharacterized protein [Apostichopus japonicus]|uniref:uncharacterized protein n=1 Tax=Stichopus japonicus TaxID=307972 RepID=UPI003AB345AC